jgi:hypothetical protein
MAQREKMMIKITLTLALVIAALTTVPASAGPDNSVQITSNSSDWVASSGGAGGNLVPLW